MSSLSNFDIVDNVFTFMEKINIGTDSAVTISPKYMSTGRCVVVNTFNYMFYKIGEGIFVHIKGGEIKNFIPFFNKNFINEWSTQLQFPGIRNPRQNIDRLNADDYFIFTQSSQENKTNVKKYKTFIDDICREFPEIDDFKFFINVRTHPILTKDGTEPYKNIWGPEVKLVSHNYPFYTPIFSSFTKKEYLDLPIPDPNVSKHTPKNFDEWINKINKAYYDGSLSDIGPETTNNLQLMLHQMATETPKFIDVNLYRDSGQIRKINGLYEVFEDIPNVHELTSNIGNLYSKYKYLIHIEGDPKSTTFFQKMCAGAIVIVIENGLFSWFTSLTTAGIHYIRISDISLIRDIVLNGKNPNSNLPINQILANANKRVKNYSGEFREHFNETFTSSYVRKNFHFQDSQYSLQVIRTRIFLWRYPKRMSEIISARDLYIEELIQDSNVKFNFQNLPRSYGKLCGAQISMNMVNANLQRIVGLDLTEVKINTDHAAFTRLTCINSLIRWVPNFIYLFQAEAIPNTSLFRGIEESMNYSGTLQTYITKSRIGFNPPPTPDFYIQFLLILVQLCFAIQVAQTKFLFMNNFLYSHTVRIVPKNPKDLLIYDMGNTKFQLVNTQFCAYITNFYESHFILDNIDHIEFQNQTYSYNAASDLLTLIFSTLQAHHLQSLEPDKNITYFTHKFIGEIYNIPDITYTQTLDYLYNTNYKKFHSLDPMQIFKIILKIEPSLSENIQVAKHTQQDNPIFRIYSSLMNAPEAYTKTLEYFSRVEINKIPNPILTTYNFSNYLDILRKLQVRIPSELTEEKKKYETYINFVKSIFNKYLEDLQRSKVNQNLRASLQKFPASDTNMISNIDDLSIPAESAVPMDEDFNWLDYRWKIQKLISMAPTTKEFLTPANKDFLNRFIQTIPIIKNKHIFIQEARKNRANLNFHNLSEFMYKMQLIDI